ncbi:DUF4139 domain-containing protein [Thioalkalivibrio paradoxus]|uniref:DUF4139 domain-containing protein n=1 Tax=Thioalkalivibrio paradoxus TaxID=108010 RepID=UPI00022C50C4|nr:DUF4139 domain-containing protein [Thioalkalivibrio paradoxus]
MTSAILRATGPLLALFLLAALSGPAIAAAEGGVRAVTVYPDRATVTREHQATIAAGEGTIRIHPLPPRLVPESLRVRAEGPDGLILSHVETRTVHGRDLAHPEERALTEALQVARDERRRRTDERQAQSMTLSFIEHLTEHAGAVEPGLPPDQWHRAWGLIGDGARDVLEQIARIDIDLREIDAEIERIERELNRLRTGRRDTTEVAILYQAAAAGEARVTLEYEIPGAGWQPAYEARLDTADGVLELVQRAEVGQNTGEKWDDVILHLATARPALGGRLPRLSPWFIDIRPPPRPRMYEDAAAPETMAARAPAPVSEAMLETSGFTTRYRVPGRVSLPPDGRQQRFVLASHRHEAAISGRAVPVLSPHAYLFAETEFAGDTPLLPGPVTLFQDGQLAGQARLDALAPGAPLRLAFGVDDRIDVRREIDRDSIGREGLLRRQQRLERSYRITVDNRHERALEVTVLDRLPVARDQRIAVELGPNATPPTERDVDGRLGVLAWTGEWAPGESRTIRFSYLVSWPEDVESIHGLDGPRP